MNVFELSAMLILNKEAYDKGLEDAEEKAKGSGSKMSDALGAAVKLIKAGFIAAGAAAVKFGIDSANTGKSFESAMSQVVATMGYTVGDLNTAGSDASKAYESLKETAEYYGKTTAFTATEAAEALNYMALAGWNVETSQKELPTILNLAAAGNMELAEASDMVTDASSALGLSLDETNLMVDQMAKAASSSNTSVSQLGEAFLTVGATAKDVSGGTTEMATILGVLADNGIKGSEAGTHLRNILLAMNPTTNEAADAWKSLGINGYDANGNLRPLQDTILDLQKATEGMSSQEKTELFTKMFNKTDLASINALLATSAERYEELDGKISSAWYTNESMRKSLEAQGLSMETMASNMQALGVGMDDFTQLLAKSGGDAETFAQSLLECANEGTSYQDVVNALGGDLGDLSTAFQDVQGAAEAMAETQLDNLEGDITKLQSAVEGLQLQFFEFENGPARSLVQFLTQGISDITDGMKADGLSGAFQAFVNTFNTGFASVYNSLMTELPMFAQTGAETLRQIAGGLADSVPELLDKVMPMLEDLSANIRENAGVLIDAGLELILQLAQGLMDSLPTLLATVPDIVINIAGVINDNAPKIFAAAVQLIWTIVKGLFEALPYLVENFGKIIEAILAVWDAINWLDLGTKVINFIHEGMNKLFSKVPELLKSIGTKAHDKLKDIKWTELGKKVINFIKEGLQALIDSIPNKLKEIGDKAFDKFKNIKWLDLGKNIVNGIINGIENMAGTLFHTLENLASEALNKAKSFLGIESPSKVFRDQVGKFIPSGIAVGVERNADSLYNSLDDVMGSAVDRAAQFSFNPVGAVVSGTGNVKIGAQPYIIYLNNVMELDGKVLATTTNEVLGAMI